MRTERNDCSQPKKPLLTIFTSIQNDGLLYARDVFRVLYNIVSMV